MSKCLSKRLFYPYLIGVASELGSGIIYNRIPFWFEEGSNITPRIVTTEAAISAVECQPIIQCQLENL
jgi:hypothetical protein